MKKYLTAITTFGSPALIDLSLSYLKMFGNNCSDFIICDDCSNNEKLINVCKKHNVKLLNLNEKSKCSDIGDMSLTLMGMKYAKDNGYEYFIKISRSWICMNSPYESLDWLTEVSDGSTFSNSVNRFNYGFNTACICYRMREWSNVISKIENEIGKWKIENPNPVFLRVEGFVHTLAKTLQPESEKYEKYQRIHFSESDSSGYVKWDWIGNQTHKVPHYILWHDDSSKNDYLNECFNIGLTEYTLEDLK